MRHYLPVVILLLVLVTAQAAEAQLRSDLPAHPAPVAVFEQPTGFALGHLFNLDNFRLSHSYELSYGNFGGEGLGLGVFTTAVQFQPNDRLSARVALGVAHSPFGSSGLQSQLGFGPDTPAQVFIRDATIAYRPTENSVISFSFQQSPYGNFYSPFGRGYGHSPFGRSAFTPDPLFFPPPSP